MELTIESAVSPSAFVGHVSYALLILSMAMTRMMWLRIIAIGSGLVALVYDIFLLFDPVGVFWETAFVLINVGQLGILIYRNRVATFSTEERAFYSNAVPTLEPGQARKLLRLGRLREASSGTVLTQEGEAVPDLIFLVDGNVDIRVAEQLVADCGPGDFIGEIGASTGGPASATAVVRGSIRYLAFESNGLRQMLDKGDEVSRAMETALRHGLREKLIRTNETLVAMSRPVAVPDR